MSDIHDTVGSQLVGVLALVRGGADAQVIEQHTADALQDLRMAVDAIQPINGNLAAVLATLRHRLQPRLQAAGLGLVWRVDDLPRLDHLTPVMVQHIQRIVMEAFSNVIQHANATSITLTALNLHESMSIEVSIADDGVGFDSHLSIAGRGLTNLRARAQAIGAALLFARHAPHGTLMRLTLPSHSSLNS
jgi:signal transduction histidine kinase